MAELHDYVVLGVPRDASPAGIRAAFRDLATCTHPDRAGAESARRSAEIREAYETLADAERWSVVGILAGATARGVRAPGGGSPRPGLGAELIRLRLASAAGRGLGAGAPRRP